MTDDLSTDVAREDRCTLSACRSPRCPDHGVDGPKWTDEQHAAYARASMGEPRKPPGSDGAS